MYKRKQRYSQNQKSTFMVSSRNKIKQIIKNVVGLSPYEVHIEALLKVGRDKKALKLAKKKLGNIKRAKKKREIVNSFLRNKKEL